MGRLRNQAISFQNAIVSDDSPYLECSQANGIYKVDELNALYPIDPRTGLETTDISKLTDPTLSYIEKERMMNALQSMQGSYLPDGLSDDEIMSLVPPRYFTNDQVDVQAWRDYLGKEILPNMSDTVVDKLESDNGSNDDSNNV